MDGPVRAGKTWKFVRTGIRSIEEARAHTLWKGGNMLSLKDEMPMWANISEKLDRFFCSEKRGQCDLSLLRQNVRQGRDT
jgi:hypothetical protein